MLKKRDKMGYGEDMNYQIVKSIEKMNSHSDKLFYEQNRQFWYCKTSTDLI